ncbi:MAG TPA: hypothetical protein VFP72_21195 [Kineosporiaceae bacterium]|nr:hypothetical protein [Kineosporiaceae bacterium]
MLRRRGDVLELIVDGVFAMDTVDTGSETALATLTLDRLAAGPSPARPRPADHPDRAPGHLTPGNGSPGWRILVGGLGLGFTAAAVLADPRVGTLEIVELQELLPQWLRAGLVPQAAGLLADPRVRVTGGDVLDVVAALPAGGVDAILLDVDNGPAFLVHQGNAEVYREPFLHRALQALADDGVLAIWSADPSPGLRDGLAAAGGQRVEEVLLEVARDGRQFTYAVYLARPPAGPPAAGPTGRPGAAR